MIYVLGASSLGKALPRFPESFLKRIDKSVDKIQGTPGLSLNPNTINKRKTVQYLLSHGLSKVDKIVLWHDVLNNSISRHSSNRYTALSLHELKIILCRYKERIAGLVVCQREFEGERTPDLYRTLQETGILTLSINRDIISKRKAKTPKFQRALLQLHQFWKFEYKTVCIVRNYLYNLSRLKTKKSKCLGARQRRALKKRAAVERAKQQKS